MGSERGRGTRDAVREAAADLIGELGWGRVSTRTVADRAGVRSGVVHYHFHSQQELLIEAATSRIAELAGEGLGALGSATDLRTGLALLLDAVAHVDATDPLHRLMAETHLAATRDPALAEALRTVVAGFRDELAVWLVSRGVASDAAPATAALVTAALDGIALHRAIDPELPVHRAASVLATLADTGGDGPCTH